MKPVPAGNDIVLAFASPILMRQVPDYLALNPALAAMLRAERDANPAPSTSSVGGWQSNTDLAVRDTPEIAALREHITSAIAELTETDLDERLEPGICQLMMHAWGNIMCDGDMADLHNHSEGNHWSGVYYVDAEAGDPNVPENGFLMLVDPRTVQPLAGPGKYRRPIRHVVIPPFNGGLILFPSWMNHYVRTYRGEQERISIAFNASVRFLPQVEPSLSDSPKI